MPNSPIQVEYNRELSALAEAMAKVERPGDFYAFGSLEAPMPRLEIEGVGTVSFPVPAEQARQIIRHSGLAPYGRGGETLVDTSVRKVWQLAPGKLRLTGKSWTETFAAILARAAEGLGAPKEGVEAELYKLLVYDEGGFFVSHRDTEKAEGMFGTLVVVLPSAHRGGELVVRHAGREAALDFGTMEVSQLTYAAFYADCEHEVRPITEGQRVCLVYNLLQRADGKRRRKSLTAPDYSGEIAAAAKILSGWAQGGEAPPKLVYLLEHQYSPAGLSWAGLKNGDAALGQTLAQAARRAGCAVHLGIVHIEESGPAELRYDPYENRRSRWRHRYDDEAEDEAEATRENFEVVEVSDSTRHINDWKNLDDQPVEFGQIPLGDGELLPEGALDDEKPDEQRVMEATGNEGASFERAYHRAAIVVWPVSRYSEVLLQAGVGAALPYLQERIERWSKQPQSAGRVRDGTEIAALAQRMVETWRDALASHQGWRLGQDATLRMRMLRALRELGDTALVRRFIEGVVLPEYDGSESAALLACGPVLGARAAGELLSRLVGQHLPRLPRPCVDLLSRVVAKHGLAKKPDWRATAECVARAAVAALPEIKAASEASDFSDWRQQRETKPLDAATLGVLLDALRELGVAALTTEAVEKLEADAATFAPDRLFAPVLARYGGQDGEAISSDPHLARLWRHTAGFLLARSGLPPEAPADWAQPVKFNCQCEDCRALQTFAVDAAAQVARFRVRQSRRQHLHRVIEHHGLDMTHVTDRKGSPQTLVCTKTRRTYEKHCEQYRRDIEHLCTLQPLLARPSTDERALLKRIHDAVTRAG